MHQASQESSSGNHASNPSQRDISFSDRHADFLARAEQKNIFNLVNRSLTSPHSDDAFASSKSGADCESAH